MSRLLATTFILVAGLGATSACETDPHEAGSSAGTELQPRSAVTAGAIDDIQAILAVQFAAWSSKDAEAYASTYAPDAIFINPLGGVLEGREAIRAQHAFLFAGPFAPSTETLAIADVEFLTGTIALVYVHGTLTGYASLPPGLTATEPGVVRTVKTWVVVKRAGSWQIVSQQITAVARTP